MTDKKSIRGPGEGPARGFSTQSVWAAEEGPFPFGAAVMPIVNAATFAYSDLSSWQEVALSLIHI